MMLGAIVDWRSAEIVRRQARVYLRNWYTALLPPVLDPLLYLFALGIGLGGYISSLQWHGMAIPYLAYVAPGIITYTAFNAPYFQSLYGAFVRMHYQKTWEGQLSTQVELTHVVAGEMLWASVQGVVYAAIVCLVLSVFVVLGVLHLHWWLMPLVLPMVFVLGCAVSLVALIFTATLPTIDHMNIPTFLVGFPLALLSDTYFPVHVHHLGMRILVGLNPVHHCAEAIRGLLLRGEIDRHAVYLLLICTVMVVVLFPIVVQLMRRRVLGE